jgi:YebC/PmpR family DNA-binding regulatory protein
MGRAFEFRKERKFKRWAQMAKVFTKIGREISMAVKESGTNPETNSKLRIAIQNAKAANMPKDNVERAIQKASGKDSESFKEVVYEGYGPGKVALIVECATDNTTRTVANVRSYFNKFGGEFASQGAFDFIFDRKAVFKIASVGLNMEELEFDLIDHGLEDIGEEDGNFVIYTAFTDFGNMQKALEEKNLEIVSAEFERMPNVIKEVSEEIAIQMNKLIDKIEEDDDVTAVFHNMG